MYNERCNDIGSSDLGTRNSSSSEFISKVSRCVNGELSKENGTNSDVRRT